MTTPAPPESPAEADRLKTAGDAAMESLRYADALDSYERAYRLDPRPALLYNQGRALQALGRYPEALDKFEGFRDTAPEELRSRVPRLGELIAEVERRVGTLLLSVEPAGARVVIRERVVGMERRSRPLRLTTGPASVEVSAPGHFAVEKILEVRAGEVQRLSIRLESISDRALLRVTSPVKGANVLVDGRSTGTVPVETMVRAGRRTIVVRRDGYEDAKTSAVLAAGESKEISVPLAEVPPITARWWFWTGLGVVVASGAAVTVALLTERDPDEGTIPPGKLPTPLVRF